jgi:predicted nucleic acid-binding protein
VSASAIPGGEVLIADTSVWRRADRLPEGLREDWERAVQNNDIASSPVVLCELLYRSKDNAAYFRRWLTAFQALSRYLIPDRRVWALAVEAYTELRDRSELAGASLTDVVLAATATRHNGLPVLHYDRDFERLAELSCMDFEPRQILPPSDLS